MFNSPISHVRPNLYLAALTLLMLFAGGCANPWKESFEPNRDLGDESFAPTSLSEEDVREIEYERLQQFNADERQRRISSTTAPADLSPQEQRAAKNRLLEALQLPWRDDEAIVLGSSQFVSNEPLKPRTNKQLRKFAEKLGADVIVFAGTYLGTAQRMENVPITSYTRDTYISSGRGRRGSRVSSYDSSSTTWMPMQVTEDRYANHAFFIRLRSRTP
jgi:hypothetical protein